MVEMADDIDKHFTLTLNRKIVVDIFIHVVAVFQIGMFVCVCMCVCVCVGVCVCVLSGRCQQ